MTQIAIKQAETQLTQLVQAARRGEDIVLMENDTPVARLVSIAEPESKPKPRPQFGSGKGLILYMAPDFDAPIGECAVAPTSCEAE